MDHEIRGVGLYHIGGGWSTYDVGLEVVSQLLWGTVHQDVQDQRLLNCQLGYGTLKRNEECVPSRADAIAEK